jgi:hypothetical protein
MISEIEKRLIIELGLTLERLTALQEAPYEQAVKLLENLKKEARASYRRLAFKYHPDRNAGNSEASKIFKTLSEVLRKVEALQIRPRRRPPPPTVFRFDYEDPVQERRAPSYAVNPTAGESRPYNASRAVNLRPV